jgi:outer membrane protein OmpA-like peptidoglycan-associated protein
VAAARADSDIVAYAPEKLQDAEQSLTRTETAFDAAAPQVELDHLAYLTARRAAIAAAMADERVALTEIEELGQESAELQVQQTERGLVVTLGDILFDVGQATLNPGGELQVARLAEVLHQMPERNLLIEGHTDSAGSDAYNDDLSQRRADAVEDLLIIQGIEPTRVVTRGYGERLPVATNDTAAGRQQNRRVEVVILNPGEVDAPRTALQ